MFPEFGVDADAGHQLVVGAFFHNRAVLDHDDAVKIADGAQTVRDDDRRAVFHKLVERLLNVSLTHAVQRARRFVQDQNRRVFEHGAGDRHALAFTAGKLDAAFADERLIALGKL